MQMIDFERRKSKTLASVLYRDRQRSRRPVALSSMVENATGVVLFSLYHDREHNISPAVFFVMTGNGTGLVLCCLS